MTIEKDLSLLHRHTFGMDVRAAYWAEYQSEQELTDLLQRFSDRSVLPIGSGSNMLFTKDFDGVLLHSSMCRAKALHETQDEVWIEAESGLIMDELIAQLADMDLRGMENLSHIPGTVGASVVQNVGAYGVEAKDVVKMVYALNRETMKVDELRAEDCGFGYRNSRFKSEWKDRYIVTRVIFRLFKEGHLCLDHGGLQSVFAGVDVDTLKANDVREAVIRIRRNKLPEVGEYGSAGSFFTNPVIMSSEFAKLQTLYPSVPHYDTSAGVKVPAAWLIEQSGCKGMQVGAARVWDKQPLVLVNTGGATSADVMLLAEQVQKRVKEQFGIDLTREVLYI